MKYKKGHDLFVLSQGDRETETWKEFEIKFLSSQTLFFAQTKKNSFSFQRDLITSKSMRMQLSEDLKTSPRGIIISLFIGFFRA